jgi:hypothetical protein
MNGRVANARVGPKVQEVLLVLFHKLCLFVICCIVIVFIFEVLFFCTIKFEKLVFLRTVEVNVFVIIVIVNVMVSVVVMFVVMMMPQPSRTGYIQCPSLAIFFSTISLDMRLP